MVLLGSKAKKAVNVYMLSRKKSVSAVVKCRAQNIKLVCRIVICGVQPCLICSINKRKVRDLFMKARCHRCVILGEHRCCALQISGLCAAHFTL